MVRGHKTASFREVCLQLGLLESDSYIEKALEETAHFQMPYLLRSLFAMLLFYYSPQNPKHLWQSFEEHLSSNYKRNLAHRHCTPLEIKRKVLLDINLTLENMRKNLDDYHFLEYSFTSCHGGQLTKEIQSEIAIPIAPEDLLLPQKLNSRQRYAFDLILDSISSSKGQAFFVDDPGGTGKTFLYRALLASLRSQGYVAIAVATSGVAASLLPGGRTVHSRFKIPLDFSKQKTCQLSKQSSVARLIVDAKLILWDEASMAKKEAIEAFHCLLIDIIESDLPFEGKTIVFGDDFLQTLPVIEHLPTADLVQSTLLYSHLWSHMCKLQLGTNMRAALDPGFQLFA
nr:uncharacterized protein LOC113740859 [Coffea arabica]